MKLPEYLISRPAKVKFRDSSNMEEGFIFVIESEMNGFFKPAKKSQFTFQFNNAPQPEKVFDLFDVDMITFL